MHQVRNQPNQPAVTHQPGVAHVCPRNACRTCNCADTCADDDHGDTDGFAERDGPVVNAERVSASGFVKRCAISGQPCSGIECREWCAGSGAGTEADHDRGLAASADHH